MSEQLHRRDRTTPIVRKEIQHSKPIEALAKNITSPPKTVLKWKHRVSVDCKDQLI